MIETIKDYLVSLGFQVDKQSYDTANNSIDSIEKGLEKFASKAVGFFGKASLAVSGFITAGAFGMGKFLDSLGNQEIRMEMLSRQLWTTQQQAMVFNSALKATGATIQDLYLSPTLMNQFQQLSTVARQLQTPSDYQNEISLVQSVSLEFKQMKLEAYYALQWIGYYFIKYMNGPITQVKNVLQSINQVIIKNMPTWTKRVAEVMASFMQAGIYIVQALGNVYTWLQKMLGYMPGWVKGIVAALAGLAVVATSNPFFLMIEGITALILLLDDFETYLHGGKSALGPFWKQLVDGYNSFTASMQKNGTLSNLISIFNSLQTIFKNVGPWFLSMVSTLSKNGTFDSFVKSVEGLLKSITDLFAAITDKKNIDSMKNFGDVMTGIIGAVIKTLAGAIAEISSLIEIASDALSGNWKAAGKAVHDMWSGQNLANLGIVPQSMVGFGNVHAPSNSPTSYLQRPSIANQSSNTTQSINAPMSLTQHIYGSGDPNATAQASANASNSYYNNNINRLIRSLRGAN